MAESMPRSADQEQSNPSEILRRGAALIRDEQRVEFALGHIDQREYDTWLAVSEWLESTASADEAMERASTFDGRRFQPTGLSDALAVARSYGRVAR